jgi:hypothetical protein
MRAFISPCWLITETGSPGARLTMTNVMTVMPNSVELKQHGAASVH